MAAGPGTRRVQPAWPRPGLLVAAVKTRIKGSVATTRPGPEKYLVVVGNLVTSMELGMEERRLETETKPAGPESGQPEFTGQ